MHEVDDKDAVVVDGDHSLTHPPLRAPLSRGDFLGVYVGYEII